MTMMSGIFDKQNTPHPDGQGERIVGHERLETTNLYNMSDAQDALDLLRRPARLAKVADDEGGKEDE